MLLREQLGLEGVKLREHRVFSDVYTPKRFRDRKKHWNIGFVFEGKMKEESFRGKRTPKAWRELRFVDFAQGTDMVRS